MNRAELIRLAMSITVIDAGGEIRITDQQYSDQPLGVLGVGWRDDNHIECNYFPGNNAPIIRDVTELGLAILTHLAGDTLTVPKRSVDKMPNGTFGHVLDDGGIRFIYAQNKEVIE